MRVGDGLSVTPMVRDAPCATVTERAVPAIEYGTHWQVAVTLGPHADPDYFLAEDVCTFFASSWKVHHNSNRMGIRLLGPKLKWAREHGGEGGSHPSNILDYGYPTGAINFTGDMPVILTLDGPSMGGFVCLATIIEADLWKVGQARPGVCTTTFSLALSLSLSLFSSCRPSDMIVSARIRSNSFKYRSSMHLKRDESCNHTSRHLRAAAARSL